MTPRRLVLDAGPLIALLHSRDPDHEPVVQGFQTLVQARTRLVAPLPIIFEVFKWLLYEAGPAAARRGLERMQEAIEITFVSPALWEAVNLAVGAIPKWKGTLEDACVALVALERDLPVWTLNYRDLQVFRALSFWSPGPASP